MNGGALVAMLGSAKLRVTAEVVGVVGLEPTIRSRGAALQTRCVCQFRHTPV